jgi:peptidoglycan hydrolase CwlO-like protein
MSTQILFSIISVAVTLGGICIAFGVIKGKVEQVAKDSEVQASKTELAAAIKQWDDLYDMLRQEVEKDRLRGDGHYKELYGILGDQRERIGKLEVSQEQIFKMLDKLETMVSSGFHDMRNDMKELRESLKQK